MKFKSSYRVGETERYRTLSDDFVSIETQRVANRAAGLANHYPAAQVRGLEDLSGILGFFNQFYCLRRPQNYLRTNSF